MPQLINFIVLFIGIFISLNTIATTLYIATASNFSTTLDKLIEEYKKSNSQIIIKKINGSTGKIFHQIINGAKYNLFFSADLDRADKLIQLNYASSHHSFVYATGQLILVSQKKIDKMLQEQEFVNKNLFKKLIGKSKKTTIAMANPEVAPYGLASQQTLDYFLLSDEPKAIQNYRLVLAENIVQSFNYIFSSAVDLGFISYSQWLQKNQQGRMIYWKIPTNIYQPIEQKVVWINKNGKQVESTRFLKFIKSPKAKQIIKNDGYLINSSTNTL